MLLLIGHSCHNDKYIYIYILFIILQMTVTEDLHNLSLMLYLAKIRYSTWHHCWCLARGQHEHRTLVWCSFFQRRHSRFMIRQHTHTRIYWSSGKDKLLGKDNFFCCSLWSSCGENDRIRFEAYLVLLFYWQTGGDVGLLTLSGKPFQVLQCNLFVPRAVCQAIIDHCVLKREKHTLVIDTRSGKKGTCLAPATAQIGRFSGRMALWMFRSPFVFVLPKKLYVPSSYT